VARTTEPVKEGSELCIPYGHMTPDVALFQYGYLLPEDPHQGAVPALSRVDETGFEAALDLFGVHVLAPPRAAITGEY